MRLYFDWRLARILDENDNIIDQINWNAEKSVSSVAKRLFDIKKDRFTNEARILYDRFDEVNILQYGHLNDPDWPEYTEEERVLFESAVLSMVKFEVAESAGNMDRRLDMLVASTKEMRSSWTTSESRCIEWIGLFLTELNLDIDRNKIIKTIVSSNSLKEAADKLDTSISKYEPSDNEWPSLKSHCKSVVELDIRIRNNEEAIRIMAFDYVPSLSALLGPLSAAKLICLAGSRERLARMPSGSLQVLGAHAAMAAHRNGAPPPKHGSVLFSIPQISKSPRWVRGKIARFIAGKASIATRIDHFNGQQWGENEVSKIYDDVSKIIDKFPKPPRRK